MGNELLLGELGRCIAMLDDFEGVTGRCLANPYKRLVWCATLINELTECLALRAARVELRSSECYRLRVEPTARALSH